MKTQKIVFYSTPGHGYGKISIKDFYKAIYPANYESRYSFRTKNFYFLEEDCDLPFLISELDKKSIPYLIVEKYAQCDEKFLTNKKIGINLVKDMNDSIIENWQVYSPDNFPILRDTTFQTYDIAKANLNLWLSRFKDQGYYSSPVHGRIHYDEIIHHCLIKKITVLIPPALTENNLVTALKTNGNLIIGRIA